MEACLEALLEMDFCTKPPNFGVEAHMEPPAGDVLRDTNFFYGLLWFWFGSQTSSIGLLIQNT
jgi:hypothetical protein